MDDIKFNNDQLLQVEGFNNDFNQSSYLIQNDEILPNNFDSQKKTLFVSGNIEQFINLSRKDSPQNSFQNVSLFFNQTKEPEQKMELAQNTSISMYYKHDICLNSSGNISPLPSHDTFSNIQSQKADFKMVSQSQSANDSSYHKTTEYQQQNEQFQSVFSQEYEDNQLQEFYCHEIINNSQSSIENNKKRDKLSQRQKQIMKQQQNTVMTHQLEFSLEQVISHHFIDLINIKMIDQQWIQNQLQSIAKEQAQIYQNNLKYHKKGNPYQPKDLEFAMQFSQDVNKHSLLKIFYPELKFNERKSKYNEIKTELGKQQKFTKSEQSLRIYIAYETSKIINELC